MSGQSHSAEWLFCFLTAAFANVQSVAAEAWPSWHAWSVSERLRIGLCFAMALGPALVGCGSGSTESAVTAAATSDAVLVDSTPEVSAATDLGVTSYVVVEGDALLAIASRHCVTATELVASNGWTDQLDHAIYPGDTIVLPAGACEPAVIQESPSSGTQLPPSTESSGTNPYLALYLDKGIMTDPFYPDLGEVDFGPACYAAYWAAHDFAVSGLGIDEFIAGLDPLPGDIPRELIATSEQWAAFSATWYPIYTSTKARVAAANPTYDAMNRALLADSGYLELLAAHENAVGQYEGMTFVEDLCRELETTQGSTP
jgi:hypothetical protein